MRIWRPKILFFKNGAAPGKGTAFGLGIKADAKGVFERKFDDTKICRNFKAKAVFVSGVKLTFLKSSLDFFAALFPSTVNFALG